MKLKKGDLVQIVKGKDSGKSGSIDKVYNKENKVLVNGVNQYKRHVKARMQGQKSEIITITKPLSVSNVLLTCPNCKKNTRVGFENIKGNKVRICRKCGKKI